MRRAIRAGDIRTLVKIGMPVTSQDDAGAERIVWTEVDAWAYIEPLAGSEYQNFMALKDQNAARVTTHVRPDVHLSARCRFVEVDSGVVHEVVAVELNYTLALVECICKTSTGDRDGR